MKRVGFIAEGYPDTGFGNYWYPLFEQFRSDKWIIPVYIQHNKETTEINKPITADIWNSYRPTPDRKVNRFFLQMLNGFPVKRHMKQFDLVHLSTDMMSFMAPNFKNQKVIITCHDLFTFQQISKKKFDFNLKIQDNLKRLLNYQSAKSLRKADTIIAISQNTKKDIMNIFDVPDEKIQVVYNGVDGNKYKPRDKNLCRQELGLPRDRFILLNIGTENDRKNIMTLLKAMKRISKEFKDILLVRIGKQNEASRRYIQENKLEYCVKYFSFVGKIESFYNAADVFVFPSVYEGFGLVVLEALASGCPVITTDESAIPEVTGDAAIKVSDPFEPDNFYQAVEKAYSSKTLREELTAKGLERSKLFSWEKCAKNTRRIYNEML